LKKYTKSNDDDTIMGKEEVMKEIKRLKKNKKTTEEGRGKD